MTFSLTSDTKIDLETDEKETADILGVSAIISYELQRTPTANYQFSFEDVIKVCVIIIAAFSFNFLFQSIQINDSSLIISECRFKWKKFPNHTLSAM